MTKEFIEGAINKSCLAVYKVGKGLIDEAASERSIVGMVVLHLAPSFPHYSVLVEYNREGEKNHRDSKRNFAGDRIVPDIIIHEPGGGGRNLVAIEVKGYWNNEPRSGDEEKLRGLGMKQGYEFLYRIELGKEGHELFEVLPI